MTMTCRIGGPDVAFVALALLAQRAGQGKRHAATGKARDTLGTLEPGMRNHVQPGFSDK